ncbi:MAG TPA: DUF1992 domain-containing protein [Gammaproteobacteria bacterium]|nr:DUF1992 domain-containing protein [Gammaproteobacteria bacterium]
MWLIDRIAEARITEARERGEFDDLPGEGRPLDLEEDALVPEELRAAYRMLKNAGYLPPALALRREIADVHALLAAAQTDEARARCGKRLNYLLARLGTQRGSESSPLLEAGYLEKLRARLGPDAGPA